MFIEQMRKLKGRKIRNKIQMQMVCMYNMSLDDNSLPEFTLLTNVVNSDK